VEALVALTDQERLNLGDFVRHYFAGPQLAETIERSEPIESPIVIEELSGVLDELAATAKKLATACA
jgi:hypothetical protein